MNKSYNKYTPKIVGLFAISTFVLVATYILVFSNLDSNTNATTKTNTTTQTATQSTTQSTTQQASTATANNDTKTYSATSSYSVPGEVNEIQVSLTIAGGVITDVQTDHSYADRESTGYIKSFDKAVSGKIVGKKITDIPSSKIGGASKTTKGFLDALNSINSQI